MIPERDPFIYITDAKAAGNLQRCFFITYVAVQFLCVTASAIVMDLYQRRTAFLPGVYVNAQILPIHRFGMAHGIFHKRLQGKFGNADILVVNGSFQVQPVVMAQLVNGDKFPDIGDFLGNGNHAVRIGDAVAHHIGDGGNDTGDIITVSG